MPFKKATRVKNLYQPGQEEPFKVSRSKIEFFLECPRCFYLDRRLGVARPPGFPFTLNTAVDTLLKKEFDVHRAKGSTHPLMKAYGLDAIPFAHENMDQWRHNFTGVRYLHEKSNLMIFGAVDDLWVNKAEELIVVDYKATSTEKEITLDEEYRQAYKRQMEIYQWLLRRNHFKVSDTGYFVYCNGRTDLKAFDGKLEFEIKVMPYTGNDEWVEKTIVKLKACLEADSIPKPTLDCEYCNYRAAAQTLESEY